MGEIIITQTKNQEYEESKAVQISTLALWTKQAKLKGWVWVQAPPCFLHSFWRSDCTGELSSAWPHPLSHLAQPSFLNLCIFPDILYFWFLASIFRLSEYERLASMRFCFFSQRPGPLPFEIVGNPYLHFDVVHALFLLHIVYSAPLFHFPSPPLLIFLPGKIYLIWCSKAVNIDSGEWSTLIFATGRF